MADITLHTPADFEGMRKAGHLAARVLDFITPHVKEGVSTQELNDLCLDFMVSHGAVSATLNYKGRHGTIPFPGAICTSVNHVVCHGMPGPKKLVSGDIINIDVTPILDGWYGDTSRMFVICKPSLRAQKLVEVTYEAMMRGIEVVRPGAHLGDIGHAIQSYAESKGFSVVRDFCGHGLGRVFHASPEVLHYGKPGTGVELKEGMFFTIEPMINAGKYDVKVLNDGWTAVTRDKSLSAQYEHSLGVTATGYEVFTL